ncbi:LuxS/MPP-like metallohydrolase [Fomes fomentarius]|nr:LuxS/MPP-like metallohydrolase [Fomes fomentarius]
MSPTAWAHVPPSGDVPSYRVFTGDLEKPELDDRQYRVLELQNGVRAVLVHDPDADKAAACLAVTIGSMYDPIDAPGMAHFCEHMISKGSEPYPEENDFISFITTNGGARNASTSPLSTDYWFAISPAQLSGGLSRLAAFFHAPLFTESLAAREINAVDSEFKRNLQNDGRRVLQLTKELSLPGHPWRKFGTGNYATLSACGRNGGARAGEGAVMKETRRRLVEWWKAHYCASRMALAVVGRESLDELTAMVVPSFSKIPNRGLDPRPAIKEPVWGPEQRGTVIFVQTVKDYHAFSLHFELPDLREHYQTRPTSFLAHFLGHEGHGSICAYLKQKGWLLSLSAGESGDARGVQLFKVEGTLTLEGYLHYESVLHTIFSYLALLRQRAFPLAPHHFAEVSTMARTRFRFREKGAPHSYASALAHSFAAPYPTEWLLSGPSQYRACDEGVLRTLLDGWRPERARVVVLAKEHREEVVVGRDVRWLTAEWYGTRYVVRRMGDALLQRLGEPGDDLESELHLPGPNPYIPTDLSVDKVAVDEPAKYPTLIKRTEKALLWHKKDDQFWAPKARFRILIKTPLAYATARHSILTRHDALSEVTYDADLAGVSYSIENHEEGITVRVGGYNDKLDVLLRTVLEKLRGLVARPDRLQVVQEKIKREYENFYLGQPSELSAKFGRWLLIPTLWTPKEKLTELPHICADDVERHRDDLLSKVCIEALVTGNLTRERALDMLAIAQECLQSRPLLSSEIPILRSLLLPTGSSFVLRKQHENPKEVNNSLSYFCQIGEPSSVALRSITALIHHMIREPCFSMLRTKEQLGYVVASMLWSINSSTLGLSIKVQSTRSPWFVEERVEAFLEAFGERLASMPDEEFARHKEGLVVKKLERVKNLGEETDRFWDRIRAGHYDFLRHETDASAIRDLSRGEVVEVYDALVRPSSGAKTRRTLSVQLLSQQLDETPPDMDQARLVVDESRFKAGLGCAPAVTPVVSDAFGEYTSVRAILCSVHSYITL